MKTFKMISASKLVTGVAAVALLAGCASGGASMNTKSGGITRHDLDYMAAVENSARFKGVNVVWINPPPELGKRYLREVK